MMDLKDYSMIRITCKHVYLRIVVKKVDSLYKESTLGQIQSGFDGVQTPGIEFKTYSVMKCVAIDDKITLINTVPNTARGGIFIK